MPLGGVGMRLPGDRGFRFPVEWLFLIVGMMKGHVGGGAGCLEPLGSGVTDKLKPFLYVLYALCIFVQERLPEMRA